MTRQDINALLYEDATVYRPPLEQDSAFLEVTHGCSWAKCRFCDFARDAFYIFDTETIESKIKLLAHIIDGNDRLYLLGQNPFCMPSKRIVSILELIKKHLPSVEQVSMYARADDINRKAWADIMEMKNLGLADLHVGVESGSDRILAMMDKGETTGHLLKAFDTLDSCQIGYHVTAIPGLGGKTLWREQALQTAELFNKINPRSIWCMTLKIWPDTPLYHMAERGAFIQMTPREVLTEERLMLEHMEMKDCLYVDSTALNKYTLAVRLPEGKDSILENIDRLLAEEE